MEMFIFLGCVASFFFVTNFISAYYKFARLDKEGGRWDSLEASTYFIAMVICFK